jgi:DNA-binding phage protein
MPKSVSYHEGLIKHLQDPVEAASYIEVVLEEGDPKILGKAIANVIEAQGGIDRFPAEVKECYEQLDLMLSEQKEIQFYCLSKLLDALGLQLAVTVKSV